MPDQADRLRQLAARSRRAEREIGCQAPGTGCGVPDPGPRSAGPGSLPTGSALRARTIAVTSGKGGVGKTCVTVNLGIALAEQGHSVVVVDLDLGLANVDVVTDLRSRHNLYHVLVGRKSLREVVVPGPGGILIVPGASGISQLADLADARRRDLIAGLSLAQSLAQRTRDSLAARRPAAGRADIVTVAGRGNDDLGARGGAAFQGRAVQRAIGIAEGDPHVVDRARLQPKEAAYKAGAANP